MSWYTLSVQSISNSLLRIHFQRPKFFYFLFTLFEVFSRTLSDTPVIFPSVFSLNVCKTILLSDNCFCRHGYCSYLLRYWDFFANIHYDIQSLPRKQKCAVDYSVIGWHLLVDTSMGQRTEATIAHTVWRRDPLPVELADDTKSIIFDSRIIKFMPTLVDIKNVWNVSWNVTNKRMFNSFNFSIRLCIVLLVCSIDIKGCCEMTYMTSWQGIMQLFTRVACM